MKIADIKKECDNLSAIYTIADIPLSEKLCNTFKKYCGIKTCESMIDVVYLWVNGSDTAFIQKIEEVAAIHSSFKDHGFDIPKKNSNRYREFNQFLYSLRSLEKNFAYARRIFIVTNGQVPSFLNLDNLQIRIVTHDELKPNNRRYPLFNSMAIQSMIHTIPTLSSPFFYCEDDMFFASPVALEDVYNITTQKSKAYLNYGVSLSYFQNQSNYKNNMFSTSIKNSIEMGKKFNLSSLIKGKDQLYFNAHVGMMLHTEIFEKMWTEYPKEMKAMSEHPFRNFADPHIWSLYMFFDTKGEYMEFSEPADKRTFFHGISERKVDDAFKKLKSGISSDINNHNRYVFACLNDEFSNLTPEMAEKVDQLYLSLFPTKSAFEKDIEEAVYGIPDIESNLIINT